MKIIAVEFKIETDNMTLLMEDQSYHAIEYSNLSETKKSLHLCDRTMKKSFERKGFQIFGRMVQTKIKWRKQERGTKKNVYWKTITDKM